MHNYTAPESAKIFNFQLYIFNSHNPINLKLTLYL